MTMKQSTIKRIVSVIVLLLTLAILFEPRIPVTADDLQENTAETESNAPSSLRLIIGTDDNAIKEDEAWISSYNSVHILQFKDEESMQAAVEKYGKSAAFIEADSGISIAEGEAAEHVETDTVMTKEDNPFTELAETQNLYGYDIALIDTGAEGANASVSMIGEAAGDDNGHGTKMLSYIRERDADASILSIKALDAKGVGETSAVYAAIRYAMESKVRIINLSVSALASEDSQIIEAAINEATQSGIVVVGAAGNNNKNASYYIPGRINSAIIAGACDGEGQKADVSNYGESVDYNVVSNTTSEAAARLTGILSVMSAEELQYIADKGGVVFHTNYEPQDMPDLPPLMDENGNFTTAASGGAHYLKDFFGITRDQFVQFLLQREHNYDYNYYLNTPYGVSWAERDSFYPNGARRSDGYAGMNCAGFIKVTVQDAGGNLSAVYRHCNYSGEDAPWGLAGASVWYKFLAGEGIVWRSYNSRDELINDGWAEKGDIIYCKPTNGGDNHIGFYWGDYPGHNLMWHSYYYGTDTYGNRMGNVIGPLDSKADSVWYVFKWENEPPVTQFRIRKKVPSGYSAEGAKYNWYLDAACTQLGGQLTIQANGYSPWQVLEITSATNTVNVWVKEVGLPTQRAENFSWHSDPKTYTLKLGPNAYYTVESFDAVSEYGYVTVQKSVTGGSVSPEGAWYAAYETRADAVNDNNRVLRFKINADETSNVERVQTAYKNLADPDSAWVGKTLYIKETSTPPKVDGYKWEIDEEIYTVNVKTQNTAEVPAMAKSKNTITPEAGYVQVHKDVPEGFSPEGAWYAAYASKADAQKDENRVARFKIEANGNSNIVRFQLDNNGTRRLFIKETSIPSSRGDHFDWKIDENIYDVTVKAANTEDAPLRVKSEDKVTKYGYLELQKTSDEPEISDKNRCYSLEGAVYEVFSDSARTKKVGTLTTNAQGKTGKIKLEADKTYYIKEKTASAGFAVSKKAVNIKVVYNQTVTAKDTEVPALDAGGIEIIKLANSEYEYRLPLEGAEFKIEYFDNTNGDVSKDPARSWTIVTRLDENDGKYRAILDEAYLTEDSSELYINKEGKVVLPIGTIRVTETKPAEGYTLTDASIETEGGETVSIDGGIYIGIIRKAGDVAHLSYGNIYNAFNTPIEIHTEALNKADGSHYIREDGTAIIRDTVTFAGTDQERLVNADGEWDWVKYRLKGEMRIYGSDEVVATAETKNFHTEKFDGHTEELIFEIPDVMQYEGKTLYVAEYLYRYVTKNVDGERKDIEELCATEDETLFPDVPEETKETQRIHIPKIATSLADEEGEKEFLVKKDITLIDRVSYQSLIAGKEYTLRGTLMDKATGKPFLDDNGKPVYSEPVTFIAPSIDGTVDISFKFEGAIAAGKKLVAFEHLYEEDGTELTAHCDLEDQDQTITVLPVEVKTSLKDKISTSDKAWNAEEVTLIDTVEYKNLRPGVEYMMKGWLMDKESGKRLKGVKAVSAKFTPKETSGFVDIGFVVPGELINGKTVVAFEELYIGKILLAEHKDIKDPGQTVDIVPVDVKTSLTNDLDGTHAVKVNKDINLTDTVKYNGLVKGREYTLKAQLVSGKTGKVLRDADGKKVEAEKTFNAAGVKGTVEVEFSFRIKNIMGDSAVAFEELYEGKVKIGEHKDINDPKQTITWKKEPTPKKPKPKKPEPKKPNPKKPTPKQPTPRTPELPKETRASIPKSGDETKTLPYMIAVLVSLALISGAAIKKIKNKR